MPRNVSIWGFAVCIDGMSTIVVNMSVTLDGVMHAPGRPDEAQGVVIATYHAKEA